MRSEALKNFIRENGTLFWYTPEDKGEKVTDELLVETMLNYGTLEQIKELFNLMGLQTVAAIFFYAINLSERRRNNFHELTVNYFTLFFNRYAS
jgi:hypothetical protein